MDDARVAVVTGAAKGIGAATVKRFVEGGARVVAVDIDAAALSSLSLAVGDRCRTVVADVSDGADVERMFSTVDDIEGRLDALVNNAAWVVPRVQALSSTPTDFERAMKNNVLSVYLCSLKATELLSGSNAASIVNLSSIAATHAFRGHLGYVSSKGAIEALTRSLSLELARLGIRVNAVAPGMVHTAPWDDISAVEAARRSALVPLGRPASTLEVADAIWFLTSDGASYITGTILHVDGGLSVQTYAAADEAPLFPVGL